MKSIVTVLLAAAPSGRVPKMLALYSPGGSPKDTGYAVPSAPAPAVFVAVDHPTVPP